MTRLLLLLMLIPCSASAQTFTTPFSGPIPDNNTEVCFPIVVSGLPTQIDMSFGISLACIDILHTYVADLKISLKAPDNTTVVLINHIGGGGDNFTGTCMAMNGTSGYVVMGAAPFSGTYIPEGSLNLFNTGIDPNGIWELCIIDEVPVDAGFFNSASITFSSNPPVDPPLPPGICSTSNASGCLCPDTTMTTCDLLPDMTASALIIQNQHTEYPGYLTLANATPNIGFGPLEVRATNTCYCDTVIVGCATPICPDGSYPKQLINQRIYTKVGQNMTFWDRPAGTMTYHPTHGHMHVDNWASYTLRVNSQDPDPLNWPVVGTGGKVSFCLVNLGSCSGNPGYCVDSLGNTILGGNLANTGLGSVSGCGQNQGIYVGSLDIYSQGLAGQQIDFPGICNGDYYIISHTDPDDNILEVIENNNHVSVPVTLTQQGTGPVNPTFIYAVNGLMVNFITTVPGIVSYKWHFGDGDSSAINNVVHTFPAPGTYTVLLELFNGVCTSYTSQLVTVDNPVGVSAPPPVVSDITIAPNPFKESAWLSYKLFGNTTVSVELYNLLGTLERVVVKENQPPGIYQYVIDDVGPGVYLLRISTPGSNILHRLVSLK
jgi:subtilisin-like proprotein convertase family protein